MIEEQEVWVPAPAPAPGLPDRVPGLALRFWKVSEGPPGQGKTRRHCYTPGDRSFDLHWEILEG